MALTNQYKNLSDDELGDAFLAAAQRNGGNAFFNSFQYAHQLYAGNYSATLNSGIDLLNRCRAIDLDAYQEIHKGSAFYWIGMAAFLIHDYQTAVFFFDAAVSEDLRRGHHPLDRPSPALHFIQVHGEVEEQAARPLVMDTQARIERVLDAYNALEDRPPGQVDMSIESVRNVFLTPAVSPGNQHLRSLATALISFLLEWDYRNTYLDLRVEAGTAEPFFIHLFKGCLLFESLLKANPLDPPPEERGTLNQVLQYLHERLGIPHDNPIGNADFPSIVADIENQPRDIPSSILVTGRVRNSVGHNLGWDIVMTNEQYQELFMRIALSIVHAIASLYQHVDDERDAH